MAITLSATFADDLLENDGTTVINQLVSGTLVLYVSNGTVGTGPGDTPPGANEALNSGNTVLATFDFSTSASDFTPPASGVLDLSFVSTTVTAVATGTAGFFRVLNTSSAALLQGIVGTSSTSPTPDWILSSTSITDGDNVSITGTPTLTLTVT